MKQHGPHIYFDTSTKGNNKFHHSYRADITIHGIRYRARSKNRAALESWLSAIKGGTR